MKSFNTLSDEDILAQLKRSDGEMDAFEELYNRYWSKCLERFRRLHRCPLEE